MWFLVHQFILSSVAVANPDANTLLRILADSNQESHSYTVTWSLSGLDLKDSKGSDVRLANDCTNLPEQSFGTHWFISKRDSLLDSPKLKTDIKALNQWMNEQCTADYHLELSAQTVEVVMTESKKTRILEQNRREEIEWEAAIKAAEAAVKAAGVPKGITLGSPVILGTMDKSLIDAVIRRNMNQIRYCYQRELTKTPGLKGKIVVKFTIAGDGSVSAASIQSTSMNSSAVENCIIGRFKKFKFPEPKGGGVVIVQYPFTFSS